jgi:hypothetical protein
MIDLNYSTMKEAWLNNRELIKYEFILEAWVGKNGQVEYGLLCDSATTQRVLNVMNEHGYRCSIVEQLLGVKK